MSRRTRQGLEARWPVEEILASRKTQQLQRIAVQQQVHYPLSSLGLGLRREWVAPGYFELELARALAALLMAERALP